MKPTSPSRLKSELWKRLLPEIDLPVLADYIGRFLDNPAGKSTRDKNFAYNLAIYLTQKYLVADHKSGELHRLIERYGSELGGFLHEISFKEFQALVGIRDQLPQPKSLKELQQALPKAPDNVPSPENEPASRKKKPRPKPKTDAERARRRKISKDDYEWRRHEYRDGLIIKQFGTFPSGTLNPRSKPWPGGPCLDILLSGGGIRMAAHRDSLENLFGVDRHRFPKLLPCKRSGRNVLYYLDAFIECMIHLLANRDGKDQWLPESLQRLIVLPGIIVRANRYSSEIGGKLAERLWPYLP